MLSSKRKSTVSVVSFKALLAHIFVCSYQKLINAVSIYKKQVTDMLDFALYDSKSKIWISPTIYQSNGFPLLLLLFLSSSGYKFSEFLGVFFEITEQYRSHIVMKSINLGTNHACHLCSFCRMRAEWVGLYIRSSINWSRMALLTWKSAGFLA